MKEEEFEIKEVEPRCHIDVGNCSVGENEESKAQIDEKDVNYAIKKMLGCDKSLQIYNVGGYNRSYFLSSYENYFTANASCFHVNLKPKDHNFMDDDLGRKII